HLSGSARPPLPAPEKHRRDLVARAPHRPGNLRVPVGPQVTVMRLSSYPSSQLAGSSSQHCSVAFQAAMPPFVGAFFPGFPSRSAKHLLLLLALSAALAFAQPPPPNQQRDLKVEKLDTVPAGTAKPIRIPVSYAVIVGISRYRNLADKDQLHFAESDAQAIFTSLISPEGGNFRVENVHLLTNDKATLAGLRREIDTWLPSVAKQDDRVLIYFAGHGFMHQGKGYLAPFDIDRDRIADTGYPMDELGNVIGGKI